MYSIKFTENNFDVSVADSGQSCLDQMAKGLNPDILLIDIIMQNMDGFQLIEELKKRSLVGDAIMIILSNLGQREDIEKGLSLGVAGYIVKANATPSEVVNKVLEIVSTKKA
jgi:CheY-like chemotaxis protein